MSVQRCPECGGYYTRPGGGSETVYRPRIVDGRCITCHGTGVVDKEEMSDTKPPSLDTDRTVYEAARYLGTTIPNLFYLMRKGGLEYRVVEGGCYLIPLRALDSLKARHRFNKPGKRKSL